MRIEDEIKKRIESQRAKLDEARRARAMKEAERRAVEVRLERAAAGDYEDEWLGRLDVVGAIGEECIENAKNALNADLGNKLVRALIDRLKFDKEVLFNNNKQILEEVTRATDMYREQLAYVAKQKDNIAVDLAGEIVSIEKQITALVNNDNKCERKWTEMSRDNELKRQFIASLDFQIERQNSLLRAYDADYEVLLANLDACLS